MDIRVLRPSDIPHVQLANITNLPENYFCKYYLYHAMSWPQLSYVAVDVSTCGLLFRPYIYHYAMQQELGIYPEKGLI
jgi:ribosomal protein S18 acetylase RimI-like enzyme